MKVIITGGGFANKGAEAMLLATADAIRRRIPEAAIHAHVNDEDSASAKGAGLRPTKSALFSRRWAAPFKHLSSIGAFLTADCVLDVGGYQFGDIWGPISAQRKERILRWAVPARTKICYLPQAWGPFESPTLLRAVRGIVNRADLCYARDEVSLRWLQQAAGSQSGHVKAGTDVAWTFAGLPRQEARRVLENSGALQSGRPIVAVTPNFGMAYRAGAGWTLANPYLRMLRDIIDCLTTYCNAHVLLIGHFYLSDAQKDDRRVCGELLTLVSNKPDVTFLSGHYSAAQIKGILGNCAVVLSSRYHALIAALSQGVPSIAFGWAHKYEALLEEVGTPQNCIQLDTNLVEVQERLTSILETRETMANAIRGRASKLVDAAHGQFDEVTELMLGVGRSNKTDYRKQRNMRTDAPSESLKKT